MLGVCVIDAMENLGSAIPSSSTHVRTLRIKVSSVSIAMEAIGVCVRIIFSMCIQTSPFGPYPFPVIDTCWESFFHV